MALSDFFAALEDFERRAVDAFSTAKDQEALEAARIEFLGAKAGELKTIQKRLGAIDKADKPAAGKGFNETRTRLEAAFEAATKRVESSAQEGPGDVLFDPTIPGRRPTIGHLHPLTQTIESLKEIMGRLGFSVADGPEIEDAWHNFEALNIPPWHPARDPLENFYLSTAQVAAGEFNVHGSAAGGPQNRGGQAHFSDEVQPQASSYSRKMSQSPGRERLTGEPLLLRSQTSTVQIRVMENTPPPVRVISLGRVYRPDTADATHYPMFQQIEGLMVDRNVTMADLKSVLRLFAMSYLGGDVHIRFRPSFFPFTEPSVEVDMSWHEGWMEMGGAGMVDPAVLEAVGYDPEEVTGFAFGLGVERVCMRRHGITDIREFYQNDVRFLHQF